MRSCHCTLIVNIAIAAARVAPEHPVPHRIAAATTLRNAPAEGAFMKTKRRTAEVTADAAVVDRSLWLSPNATAITPVVSRVLWAADTVLSRGKITGRDAAAMRLGRTNLQALSEQLQELLSALPSRCRPHWIRCRATAAQRGRDLVLASIPYAQCAKNDKRGTPRAYETETSRQA